MKRKIAIVVQRYGLTVNGGAEFHARILAEQLAKNYNIEILTTTALDYRGWANHFEPGLDEVNGIVVRRFSTLPQNGKKARNARRIVCQDKRYFRVLKFLKLYKTVEAAFNISKVTDQNVQDWITGQGPCVPDLIRYISEAENDYDAFIFFTYLYYPTVLGMPLVANKTIFIPTAHDEPILFTKPYENLFKLPKFIMYNTVSEKNLVEKTFQNCTKNSDVAGVGIVPFCGECEALTDELLPKKYFVYVGRIDSAKGCGTMIESFLEFKKKHKLFSEFKLVLVGKDNMKKTYHNSSIIYTGFVSEAQKYTYISNALAMIMPSQYESLSLVTLEAMAAGIPVIVNGDCEVLNNHISNSKTGACFNCDGSLAKNLEKDINASENFLAEESTAAKKYVAENFEWDSILKKFDAAIDFVINENSIG